MDGGWSLRLQGRGPDKGPPTLSSTSTLTLRTAGPQNQVKPGQSQGIQGKSPHPSAISPPGWTWNLSSQEGKGPSAGGPGAPCSPRPHPIIQLRTGGRTKDRSWSAFPRVATKGRSRRESLPHFLWLRNQPGSEASLTEPQPPPLFGVASALGPESQLRVFQRAGQRLPEREP